MNGVFELLGSRRKEERPGSRLGTSAAKEAHSGMIGKAAAAAAVLLLWASIAEAQGSRCWTFANCAAKCASYYGHLGANVVDYCITQGVPCSKFPKTCAGTRTKGSTKGK